MSVITAQNIVDKAEIIIQDTTNVRWPAAELLGWLNDAQRQIVLLKPESNITNSAVVLVEGTKQTIPATGIQLIDVVRNMGTDGTTAGNAITYLPRYILDTQNPSWHADDASATVQHYMFDGRDPRNFYVYPPQPSSSFGYVELVYATAPADIAIDATITLDDIYANCLLDYILYRAYSKDKDFASNAERAIAHYRTFMESVTGRQQAEEIVDPESNAKHPTTLR